MSEVEKLYHTGMISDMAVLPAKDELENVIFAENLRFFSLVPLK